MLRSAVAALMLLLAAPVLPQEIPLTGVQYGAAPFARLTPQMASDGTNFLAAWRDGRRGSGPESIFAARVAPDGRLLDEPTAIAVRDSMMSGPPAVLWTGRLFVVAWTDLVLGGMQLVRIDREGRVLDARPRSVPAVDYLWYSASASAGDRALIVWGRLANGGSEILGATLLDANGEVSIERIVISRLSGDVNGNVAVASNGAGFLAAWARRTGSDYQLMLAPVSRTGAVGAERPAGLTRATPVIAANGSDYLVAYTNVTKNLVMARVDANGQPIGAANAHSIVFNELFMGAAMTPSGSGYLFVDRSLDRTVRAMQVDRDGKFVESRLLNASGKAESPVALATNGSVTAAVWPEADLPSANPVRMYARVFEAPGMPTLLSRAAPVQSRVRAATNGNGYLAAFLNSPAGTELRVARMDAKGNRLDAAGIFLDDGVADPAQVVFDGRNYVVAWTRRSQCGIHVNRVAADGTLLDGPRGTLIVTTCAATFGIGSNGAETLLVWSSTFNPNGITPIFAQRMKQDGTLDAAQIQIPNRDHLAAQFSVAWSRGTWLVAWRESILIPSLLIFPIYQNNILAARISNGGTLLDGVPIAIAETDGYETDPAVAAGGSDFLVAWRELLAGDNWFVRARRAGFDGVRGEVTEIARTSRVLKSPTLSVLPSGSSYLVAFEDSGDLYQSLLGSGARTPLAASADEEGDVTILPAASGTAAFYARTATESLYGGTSRAFVRFLSSASRTRSARH